MQGRTLGAQAQAAAALVLGIRCALQPTLVLQHPHHAGHLCLVGTAVRHQFALRGARVAPHEHQRPHFVVRQVGVDGGHRAHHVRPVDMQQVVHGFKDIGGCVGRHGDM
ncbi:hypothetical protein D3C71_1958530 [compost metagenome]